VGVQHTNWFCGPAGEEKLMYSSFGASCSEVEINMLTGERRVLRADIMLDAGNSLSPAIDAGQASLELISLHQHQNVIAPDA
jgi:xanthine dehydrogenase molybdopterin-binding subunit B